MKGFLLSFFKSLLSDFIISLIFASLNSYIWDINFLSSLYLIIINYYYIWILLLVIFFIIFYANYKMNRTVRRDSLYLISTDRVGIYEYKGEWWEVRVSTSFNGTINTIEIGNIFCSYCSTETIYSKEFLFYQWKCPNCSYKIRTWTHKSTYQKYVKHVLEKDMRTNNIYTIDKLNEFLIFRIREHNKNIKNNN